MGIFDSLFNEPSYSHCEPAVLGPKRTDDDVIVDLLYGDDGKIGETKQGVTMSESEYDNNLRGALYKVDDPKTDKSPVLTGKLEISEEELRLSAWKKHNRKGPYFSIAASEGAETGYARRGGGFISPNEDASNEKSPKFKGKVTIDDIEYEVAAWDREPSGGAESSYLSLTLDTDVQFEEVDPEGALDF